jgi:L-cystine uptake protein TcyP (sodium:dicarboxylate symporter family)
MFNVIVISLFALMHRSVAQMYGKHSALPNISNTQDSADNLIDGLMNTLVDRALNLFPLHEAMLADTTLAGISHTRSLFPMHRFAFSALPSRSPAGTRSLQSSRSLPIAWAWTK